MTVKQGFSIAVILGCVLGGLFTQADQNLTITGHIRNIAPEYGNLNTSFTQADLDQLGLVSTDQFLIQADHRQISVTLGTQYADVARGQWIGFIDWEGFLRIAVHYGNAAEQLTVHQHSQLQLSRPID
jgi:S-adenosylmethionine hydrolase